MSVLEMNQFLGRQTLIGTLPVFNNMLRGITYIQNMDDHGFSWGVHLYRALLFCMYVFITLSIYSVCAARAS